MNPIIKLKTGFLQNFNYFHVTRKLGFVHRRSARGISIFFPSVTHHINPYLRIRERRSSHSINPPEFLSRLGGTEESMRMEES